MTRDNARRNGTCTMCYSAALFGLVGYGALYAYVKYWTLYCLYCDEARETIEKYRVFVGSDLCTDPRLLSLTENVNDCSPKRLIIKQGYKTLARNKYLEDMSLLKELNIAAYADSVFWLVYIVFFIVLVLAAKNLLTVLFIRQESWGMLPLHSNSNSVLHDFRQHQRQSSEVLRAPPQSRLAEHDHND